MNPNQAGLTCPPARLAEPEAVPGAPLPPAALAPAETPSSPGPRLSPLPRERAPLAAPESRGSRSSLGDVLIPGCSFFCGLAGMSAVLALGGWAVDDASLIRAAMWTAGLGALVSPLLLAWEFGRPLRFRHLLRICQLPSTGSVGAWIVVGFCATTIPGAVLAEFSWRALENDALTTPLWVLRDLSVMFSALIGVLLSAYTGTLFAVTVVPAWFPGRVRFSVPLGSSALGSAACWLILLGFSHPALMIGAVALAGLQTLLAMLLFLCWRSTVVPLFGRARSGLWMAGAEFCLGPGALLLFGLGQPRAAALAFLFGALLRRWVWVRVGRRAVRPPVAA